MNPSNPPVVLVNACEGTARGERYDHWRRGFFSVEIEPSRDGVIDMHAEIANLQPVAIAISSGTSCDPARGRPAVRTRDD